MAEERNRPKTGKDLVLSKATDIEHLLPASLPSAKFLNVFKTAWLRQPELARCSPVSVFQACLKAAADGLSFDGREAALVVFKNEAVYVPMYQGMIKRAFASGYVDNIYANVVYENELNEDRFTFEDGIPQKLYHKPILNGIKGPLALAYSVVRMKGSSYPVAMIMEREEILAIKAKSRGGSSSFSPWKTNEGEMWKKTVLRRHMKTLPFDSDLARLFGRIDELYDLDKPRKGDASEVLSVGEEGYMVDPETGELTPE